MSPAFTIKEHIIPGSHLREDVITMRADDPIYQVHIKQYIPLNNPSPNDGDVTIIGCHGNGFVKVCLPPYHILLTG
jgi:hypothetical protein